MDDPHQLYGTVRDWSRGVEIENPLLGLLAAFVVVVVGLMVVRLISVLGRRPAARFERERGHGSGHSEGGVHAPAH